MKQNAVFDGIVSIVRSAKGIVSDRGEESRPIVELDFADRALLDSTLLPFQQSEIVVSFPEGKRQQLVAVVEGYGNTALVVSEKGLLFVVTPGECAEGACMMPAGTLVRPDGSPLDDIYDMLAVPNGREREFYVSYGEEDPDDNTKAFIVSRLAIPAEPDADARYSLEDRIFESRRFTLDNGQARVSGGGAMVFDASDNAILVTIGDFGLNGHANRFEGATPPAQDPESDLGKIHSIDLATGDNEILTIGHRNPQGLTRTAAGELISSEHGPKGGDEINLIVPGENYGWPEVSLGTLYEQYTFPSKPLDPSKVHGGYRAPLMAFVPSVGIGALIEVQDLHEAWDGDLLVATLKAQSLYRVRRWESGYYSEHIHAGDRIRDLEIVDGVLLLATDSGKLILLTPIEDVESARTSTGLVANKTALSKCGQCHNLTSARSTEFAPHLINVVSRPIASLEDFDGYSDSLKGKGEMTWSMANLEQFLRDPSAFAPDGGMPAVELTEAQIKEILDLLSLLR